MNAYEVEKLSKDRKARLVHEHTHTEIDAETGAITRVTHDTDGYIGTEPEYVKIYTDCQLVLNNIDIALSPYIIAFARYMTYANADNPSFRCVVQTSRFVREQIAALLGVSDRQVHRAIRQLVDAEVFIPIVQNGRRCRGTYFVNPWVMAKGEWKDIKQLRQSFEYVTGASSVCAIEADGTRKVIMPLTIREDKSSGQLEFTTTQEEDDQ